MKLVFKAAHKGHEVLNETRLIIEGDTVNISCQFYIDGMKMPDPLQLTIYAEALGRRIPHPSVPIPIFDCRQPR
jgi:hypothetical protein